MNSVNIYYKVNEATVKSIEDHLNKCSDLFNPRLASYVNIKEYSKKIRENATTIEAWHSNNLIGLVACYLNNKDTLEGYITNVSITGDFQGKGIALELLNMTISEALERGFKRIGLEVEVDNNKAINLYRKTRFVLSGREGNKYFMLNRLDDKKEVVVSICCVTYNHVNYISDAIYGFLMQKTTFPLEILIHDDASTDGTTNIIKEYESKYPGIIKSIYQKENQYSQGRTISPVYQFPRARGKYIALCEGDDYWTDPYKLQKQVDFLEANSDFVLVGHPSLAIYENQAKPPEVYHKIEKDVLRKKDIIPSYLLQAASIMFRNDVLKKNDLSGIMGEHSMYILLTQYGKFKVLPEVMSVYKIHSSGASGTSTPQKAYPGQLGWIRNLKRVMGSDFFWGYHFLTSKVHTYYAITHPEVFTKGILFKYYYSFKYAFLMLILYPRNIRTVFRMISELNKSKTLE